MELRVSKSLDRALALFLLCALTLLSQQSEVERAWNLAGNGQRSEAIRVLRGVLAKSPASVDAMLLLGSLLSDSGDAPDAITVLSGAVERRPHSVEAQNALGEAYLAAGDIKDARSPFEKASTLDPRFAPAQLNLGSVLLQSGSYEAAGKHLDDAIKLLKDSDSDAPYAHYLRAKVSTALADPKGAAAELERAIALRPSYAEAWSDLGQVRRLLLDDAGSLAAAEKAVDLNPKDAVAQYRLGAEYLREGQIQRAIEHLQTAYEANPQDQSTLNALQNALRQGGRKVEADAIKQKLADVLHARDHANQNELRAVKLNNEGARLQKSGDLTGALERYKEALTLYPAHVGIRVNYAIALLRLGKWTEGLNELHEASMRAPGNAQIRAAISDAIRQAPEGSVPRWAPE